MKKLLWMFRIFLFPLLFLTTLLQAEVPTYENVTRLYVATFNRAPDAAGLEYWVTQSNLRLEQIGQSFFDQPETQERYPAGTSDHDFIKVVYTNLFNRDPDSAGWRYWEEELLSKRVPKPVFILAVINGAQDTEEFGLDQTILENKKEVGLYYVQSGLNDVTWAKEVMVEVTADPQSVEDAKEMIDDFKEEMLRQNAIPLLSLVTDMGYGKVNGVLSPNKTATLELDGLKEEGVTLRVNTTGEEEVVLPVSVSLQDQRIVFVSPVNVTEGNLTVLDSSGTPLSIVHYQTVTMQTPLITKITPEVAEAGAQVTISGVNLPAASIQVVFEEQNTSLTQTVTPVGESVSFTVPQNARSGNIYLKIYQAETNRLYLSVKREVEVEVKIAGGVDVNVSDILFIRGLDTFTMNENNRTRLLVKNNDLSYINVLTKRSNGESAVLYTTVILPDMNSTVKMDANSTAAALVMMGMGASVTTPSDEWRSLYEHILSNVKVQEFADYINTLQKSNFDAWDAHNDEALDTKFKNALQSVLQTNIQHFNEKMLAGKATDGATVVIRQEPENDNIYIDDYRYLLQINTGNKLNNGSVNIINDTRLYLSVEVSKKENGDIVNGYSHYDNINEINSKSLVGPKGWFFTGFSRLKELELKGTDSFVEIIVGAKNGNSSNEKLADSLMCRVWISGVAAPILDQVLSTILNSSLNGRYGEDPTYMKRLINGLSGIYGAGFIDDLTYKLKNGMDYGEITKTVLIDPIYNGLSNCAGDGLSNPICVNTLSGIAQMIGLGNTDDVLAMLMTRMAIAFEKKVIKGAIISIPYAGWVVGIASAAYESLGLASNIGTVAESFQNMSTNPREIKVEVDFVLEVSKVDPLCLAVTSDIGSYDYSFAVEGEGLRLLDGTVPDLWMLTNDILDRVEGHSALVNTEGTRMLGVFDTPQLFISKGSTEGTFFVGYDSSFWMMYPTHIRLIDPEDDVVYFDTITPSSAYRGATVTLKGCGWVPLDEIKVYFSKQDSSEYVEVEILTRTADTLTVKVPNSAKSGTVYVTAGNKETRKLLFDVNPFSLDDPIEGNTLIKGTWIELSGQALTQAEKIYFTDHSGHKIEGTISDTGEYSLRATIPEGLAYGPVRIYAETHEGIVSNEITMPLVPKGVDANPSSQGFTDTIQVTLTQEDHADIYYRIDEGAEQLYTGTITLHKAEAQFEYFSIYTVARVMVDGVKYESNELEYTYTPCGYAEELIDNECIAPCPENEELIDGTCVNIFKGHSCPMIYDASLDDSPNSYFLDIIIKIRDKDNDEQFEDCIRCSYCASYQLKWETPYINSKKSGLEKLYYESGQIWRITSYIEDKRNGLYKSYYESGNPEWEISYVDDIKHGLEKWYYDNGHLKQIIPYVEGKQQGIIKQYYESGQLYKEKPFYVDGIQKSYYESGQLYFEASIINGKINGLAKMYYESGALYSIEPFVDGKLEGNYEFYSPAGVSCLCIIFENGVDVGYCRVDDNNACLNYPPPEIPYLRF